MKPLAITLGDPAGIGAEVIFRALEELEADRPLWLFGDWQYAEETLRSIGMDFTGFERVTDLVTARDSASPVVFVDIGDFVDDPLRFGVVSPRYGEVALRAIELSLAAIDEDLCMGLVTGPINKQAVKAAGSPYAGHTELLAAHYGRRRYGEDYAMYFDSPTLRVVLMSVHVPLAEAILRITAESLLALVLLTHQEFANFYGVRPRIAVAGLNPHAGEGGMFGEEEIAIREGVEQARALGMTISGPHPPDAIFRSAAAGEYDVVVAMYHDQGLIPVKTLHFRESVNVTLGLPCMRCSVDHGTAFDIAGKGIADARPMRYAIEWAIRHINES